MSNWGEAINSDKYQLQHAKRSCSNTYGLYNQRRQIARYVFSPFVSACHWLDYFSFYFWPIDIKPYNVNTSDVSAHSSSPGRNLTRGRCFECVFALNSFPHPFKNIHNKGKTMDIVHCVRHLGVTVESGFRWSLRMQDVVRKRRDFSPPLGRLHNLCPTMLRLCKYLKNITKHQFVMCCFALWIL